MLLSACTAELTPTSVPTTVPVTTAEATTLPATQPDSPPATEPSKPAAELTTAADFQTFLTQEYWYWRALSCTFETPSQINAEYYFYNGLHYGQRQNPSAYTEQEIAYLEAELGARLGERYTPGGWQNTQKLPAQKINEALEILGVTLSEITVPDSWVYYDAADAYYAYHWDAFGAVGVTVTEVVTGEDGTVQVYWTLSGPHLNTLTGEFLSDPRMVLTLELREDGTYLVQSNLPVENG
jgi:hypothetical protein